MTETIRLPKLDQDMTEGHLLEWLVEIGDHVVKDQPVAVIETDKVSTELTSSIDGVVTSIFVAAGANAPVGAKLAEIRTGSGASTDEVGLSTSSDPDVAADETRDAPAPAPASSSADARSSVTSIGASGPTAGADDVRLPLDRDWPRPHSLTPRRRSRDAPPGLEAFPLLALARRAGIETTEASGQVLPFAARAQISAVRLLEVLAALKLSYGSEFSLTHLLVKLAAQACRDVPEVNGYYDGNQRVLLESVDVNLLVAAGDDLLSPRVEDVCRKSIRDLANETTAAVEACRNQTVSQEDLRLGSFTISNLGMYGLDDFTPLVVPPQLAILGIGRVMGEPARFHSTLVVDYRAVNGVNAARYLGRFRSLCEEPLQLL
jgi:pyruvate dehydrogenase E2 component (dihydrolipoamide acetyltransferase)